MQCSQLIPFDAFGKMSAQANDSYTITGILVLYKIHMAKSSFSDIIFIFWAQLLKNWITYSLDKSTIQHSQSST